ncbi:uncharacterized protein DMENIID0001_097570 [Sergentomyia squamirostris]
MIVPEILDQKFFENVLKSGLQLKEVQVTNLDITLGAAPGDNYCSTIYRAVISYRENDDEIKTSRVIVKYMPKDEMSGAVLARCKVFEKEVKMLDKFLPRLSELASGVKFGAKFYSKFENDTVSVIVMEDLSTNGYRMADRQLSLNRDHCAIVLKKLGKLHAASMLLFKEEPSIHDIYDFGLVEGSIENPGICQAILSEHFPAICENVKTWEGFEDIHKKLEKFKPNLWKRIYECVSRDYDGFRVLNHGDFWVNNFLFKYDEESEKPLDCILVDFQFTYFSTPAHDLQYFFGTSASPEMGVHEQEGLLLEYYATFKDVLESSKYPKIPTLDDLQKEMSKRLLYNLFASTHVLPFVLMERQSEKGNGLDGLLDESTKRDMLQISMSGKRFVEVTKINMKRFDKVSLFD